MTTPNSHGHVLLVVALGILTSLTVGACSKQGDSFETEEMGTVAATAVGEDFDMTGTWRFEAIRTSAADGGIIGTIKNQLVLEGIAKITQDDDGTVTMERTVCRGELLSERKSVKSTIEPLYLHELYSDTRTGTLTIEEGQAELVFPDVYYVSGADLENPGEDALPTSMDDPRVTDADSDGHPGMTIHVDGFVSGQIYLVQRVTSSWHSTAVSLSGVEGRIEWSEEREILDATAGRLEDKRDAWVTNNPNENRFVLMRADDDLHCREFDTPDDAHPEIMETEETPPEGARTETDPAETVTPGETENSNE
jgi:hypothetical protein